MAVRQVNTCSVATGEGAGGGGGGGDETGGGWGGGGLSV